MWSKISTKASAVILVIAFSIAVMFSSNTASAQDFYKINSNVPAGSTNTTTNDSGNSTTYIYVALGLAVVGVLAYKFVFKKDKDVDSTAAKTSSLLIQGHSALPDKSTELAERQNPLPVNLYLAVKRDAILPDQKTYMVGLSFNF